MHFLLHCKPNLEFVFAIITLAPLKKKCAVTPDA